MSTVSVSLATNIKATITYEVAKRQFSKPDAYESWEMVVTQVLLEDTVKHNEAERWLGVQFAPKTRRDHIVSPEPPDPWNADDYYVPKGNKSHAKALNLTTVMRLTREAYNVTWDFNVIYRTYNSAGSRTGNYDKTVSVSIPLPQETFYVVTYEISADSGLPLLEARKWITEDYELEDAYVEPDGYSFKYWRDEDGGRHVPGEVYSYNAHLTLSPLYHRTPDLESAALTRVASTGGSPDPMGGCLRVEFSATSHDDDDGDAYKPRRLVLRETAGGEILHSVSNSSSANPWSDSFVIDVGGKPDVAEEYFLTIIDGLAGSDADYSACSYAQTLPAVPDYTRPALSSLRVQRAALHDGTPVPSDNGNMLMATVDWSVAYLGSQEGPSSLTVRVLDAEGNPLVDRHGKTEWVVEEFSGTVNQEEHTVSGITEIVLGNGDGLFFADEGSYSLTLTLADAAHTAAAGFLVETSFYTVHFLGARHWDADNQTGERPGHGIAFGAPCETEGFHVHMEADFNEPVDFSELPTIAGSPLLDLVYPVGSIYLSANPTDPGTLFGGTWQRIQGQFLLGATDNGATGSSILSDAAVEAGSSGGEASHLLTAAESGLRSHNHSAIPSNGASGSYLRAAPRTQGGSSGTGNFAPWFGTGYGGTQCGTTNVAAQDATVAHNNMPPFLAVYMWQRSS